MTRSGPRTRIWVSGIEIRTDLESGRDILKNDGSPHRNFRELLVTGNYEPQSGGKEQRQDFQSEIVNHVTFQKRDHARGSEDDGSDF